MKVGEFVLTGVEPSFGVNAFNKAKYKNETETVAMAILALLFGRPGFFPSMPNLGIHIQDTLYMYWDEINPEMIKAQIIAQCREFYDFVADGSLDVIKSSYMDEPLLIIVIPVQIKQQEENLAIGITQNADGQIVYNYGYQTTES